jgi:hypothetical protein
MSKQEKEKTLYEQFIEDKSLEEVNKKRQRVRFQDQDNEI